MNTVREYIDDHADHQGDRPFLIAPDSDRTLNYVNLKSSVDRIGSQLDRLGFKSGAKIAFLLNNGYWTTQLFLGVMANNRVIVPLNAVSGKIQLQHVLSHSDAEAVFVAAEFQPMLDDLMTAINRDILVIPCTTESGPDWPLVNPRHGAVALPPASQDTALLLYTSGSTGLPKGAILSHRAVTRGGQNVAGGHNLTKDDRALCVLPVYHINGAMVTVSAPLVSGGSVVMPERFRASTFWALIEKYQCTWSSIVPTIIKYLLDRADQEPFDFGQDSRLQCFRFGRSASAPLPAVVLQQWEQIFRVPLIETLGLTETAGTVATNPMPPLERKAGSVGLAYGNEIQVFDEDNNCCAANVSGEIVIRGDNLLDAYYNNSDATQSSFTNGWFRSGDLGLKDEDGYLFITGRLKELIIRGGENIAPREIDDVLYKHESILEAAAVGIEDENYGQEVVACVVVREGHSCSEEELQAMCEAAVGKYKTPKKIYFMDDLPKGPSGKILRLKLPELIAALSENT